MSEPAPEDEYLPPFMVHAGSGVVWFAEDRNDHVRYAFGDERIELDGEFTADELREMARMMDTAASNRR